MGIYISEHFTLHELAKGIYTTIALPGGGAYSNAEEYYCLDQC